MFYSSEPKFGTSFRCHPVYLMLQQSWSLLLHF